MIDLKKLTPPELLVMHAAISEELRCREITRSSNNPVGDLAEYLFCKAFGWSAAKQSMRDVDAEDAQGVFYQIKSRRLTTHNQSRQLGALRDLDERKFDYLAAVLFNHNYCVLRAALVPHEIVTRLATRVERTNSYRFLLRDSVWLNKDVRDVTEELRQTERLWASALIEAESAE